MKRFYLITIIFTALLMQGFVNAQSLELTILQKVRALIQQAVPDSAGLLNTNLKVDTLRLKVDSLRNVIESFEGGTSSGNPDSLNSLPASSYMLKNDSLIFASRYYTDQQLLTKAASNHNHNGTYEPAITKFTGYLRYTGSAWQFLNEAYSLSSHNHSGVYEPVKGADDNYVTDAEKIVIGNTSGTNTGDNATNSQYSGLASSKQDVLQSGANIKTINNQDITGPGNINITGFDSIAVVETAQALIDTTGDQLSYTVAEMDSLLLLAGQVPALQDSIASFRTILNSILTALDTCGCGANLSDNTPPLPPSSYTAIGGTSQTQYVTTWTDPTALDLDSLRWYEGSSNDTTTWNWIASIAPGIQTYTRTGRSAGTTYWSGVKAIDDSGNVSWFSNVDSATTQSTPAGSEEMEVTRWKQGLALNDSTISHINNFVVMLKDTFALDSLSEMWNVILVQANENPLSSLHNLVKRSNDADTNLTMEWTQWEGWNGDRTDNFNDGYINLNYNPYSDAGITTKDDFSISVFMRQDYDASGPIDAGVMIAATSDTGQIHFTIRRDDNEMGFRVNDLSWASPLFYNTGIDSSAGLYTITRSASDRFCYKNNTQKYTDNVASQSFPNKTMLMFRNQSSSTPDPSGMNSPKQTSFLLIGKHLSLSQHRSLFNICKAFLQGIGKDVTTY